MTPRTRWPHHARPGWEARRIQQRRELAWWLGAVIVILALLALGGQVYIDLWAMQG